MTHEQALEKLSSEHRVIIKRMVTGCAPLEPNELAALRKFVEYLRAGESSTEAGK